MNALLIRHPQPGRTFGVLVLDNGWTCQTLERPWLGNAQNVSCIPEGTYTVIPHTSPSRGECFAVLDVPDRTHILFHALNDVSETEGCIGVGFQRSRDGLVRRPNDPKRAALKELLKQAPNGFKLKIIYAS